MIQTILHKQSTLDDKYIQIEFTDNVILKSEKKKIAGIGTKTAELSTYFFEYLTGYQVPTAYVKRDGHNVIKFVDCTEYKFTVRILNNADKRISKIFNIKENSELKLPIYELIFGETKDNLINESHLISFDLCNSEELKIILRISSKINAVLKSFSDRRNEILTELNLKFGKFQDKIYLTNYFSPFTIKISPKEENTKWVDPNNIKSISDFKKYSNFLFKIVNQKL